LGWWGGLGAPGGLSYFDPVGQARPSCCVMDLMSLMGLMDLMDGPNGGSYVAASNTLRRAEPGKQVLPRWRGSEVVLRDLHVSHGESVTLRASVKIGCPSR